MKYICLGYYDPASQAAWTADERNAMLDACFAYDEHLRANGHYAGGEGLQPSDAALTLYWQNDHVATTDGPYAETKEQLGGLLLLEARDMNHAIALMSQHPSVKFGSRWEIRPAADMSAMTKASEERRCKAGAR
jgi:hypothetical protein